MRWLLRKKDLLKMIIRKAPNLVKKNLKSRKVMRKDLTATDLMKEDVKATDLMKKDPEKAPDLIMHLSFCRLMMVDLKLKNVVKNNPTMMCIF